VCSTGVICRRKVRFDSIHEFVLELDGNGNCVLVLGESRIGTYGITAIYMIPVNKTG